MFETDPYEAMLIRICLRFNKLPEDFGNYKQKEIIKLYAMVIYEQEKIKEQSEE